MSASRVCKRCGADISNRDVRAVYCTEGSCRRHARRAKPCQRCGSPKGENLRQGSRFCAPCQEIIDSKDHVRQQDRERRRRERMAKLDAGKRSRVRRDAPEGEKWCAHCQRFLPFASFALNGEKLASYCIPCAKAYMHAQMLKRDYGITPERYEELYELQGGRCAICLTKPRKRRLSVDHDHQTGQVRGLLCTRCNHGILGRAHDSAAMLERALLYLRFPPAQTGEPIADHQAAQQDIEFIQEQVAFLADGGIAVHPSRGLVAVTDATFAALAAAAGRSLYIEGRTVSPPPQLSPTDLDIVQTLATEAAIALGVDH